MIKSSTVLYDFLTITSESDFKKKKEDYENQEGVNKLKETKNLEGILYSRFNKDLSKQHKVLKEYVNLNEVLLSKLTQSYDVLKLDFLKVSDTLSSISEIYRQLKANSEEYMDPHPILNTYGMLEQLNKDWSTNYKKQTEVFEVDFKEYFDFFRVELDSIKEQITLYQDVKDEYLRYHTNLVHKKERLFNNQAMHKWEMSEEDFSKADASLLTDKAEAFRVMCYNDTKEVESKRRKLGVYCYALLDDFLKLRAYHSRKFKNHFINLCGRNTELLADSFGLVKLLHMNAQEMKQKHKKIKEKKEKEIGNLEDNSKEASEIANDDDLEDDGYYRTPSIYRKKDLTKEGKRESVEIIKNLEGPNNESSANDQQGINKSSKQANLD